MKRMIPLLALASLAPLLLLSNGWAADAPKTITLPQFEPALPDGPGRELVLSNCVICHSTRFIGMQPRFPRAVWQAEVDKMRKTFGAPIQDDVAAKIVDYLVATRGTEPAVAKPGTGDVQRK